METNDIDQSWAKVITTRDIIDRDKVILIDNEIPTTHLIPQFVKGERPRGCKIFCWIKNILYIAAFILIFIFLISLMKSSDIRGLNRGNPAISDDPVNEQSVIKQKVAELEGQVSLKNNALIVFQRDVGYNLHSLN